MAKCERCGTTFEPQAASGAVATTKILCPPCLSAYLAEKAAKRAPAAVPPAAAKPSPVAVKPPAPAAPRPAAPAMAKAPAPATPKAAAPAASATPATPRRQGAHAESTSDRRRHGHGHHDHTPKTADDQMNKAAKIGGIIGLLVIVAAVGAVFMLKSRRDNDAAIVREHDTKLASFMKDIRELKPELPTDAQRLIDRAIAQQDFWRDERVAGEINTLIAKAKVTLETELGNKATENEIAEIEKAARDAALKTADDLNAIRRKAEALETRASTAGSDLAERLKKAKLDITKAYGTRTHEEAKSYVIQKPTDLDGQLAKFKRAEDQLRELIDKANAQQLRDLATVFEGELTAVIAESDEVAMKAFTPERIAATPVRDLLKDQKEWQPTEAKGFSPRVQGGVMDIVGPDADVAGKALYTIGDREEWRDFVIDMDVQLVEGTPIVAVRLGRQYDNRTPKFALGEGYRSADSFKHLTITMIGSSLKATVEGDSVPPFDFTLPTSAPRKGAFGFVIPPGVRMHITRLTVRNLR